MNNTGVVTSETFPLPSKGFIGFSKCSRRRMSRISRRSAPRIYLGFHPCFCGKLAFIHTSKMETAHSGPKQLELSVFRGGVQATKHACKATKEVPVAAPTGHCAQVVTQNNKRPEAEQNEHQDGNPRWAHVVALWRGRRIARAGIRRIHAMHALRVGMVKMMCLVQATRLSAFRSYTTTGFAFWRSHEKRV